MDIMNVRITPVGPATIELAADFLIECRAVDSEDQARVLADLTGPDAVRFSQILASLSEAEILALATGQGLERLVASRLEAIGG